MNVDDRIDQLRSQPRATGIFLDFDGTLAPIVDDPQAAAIVPGGTGVLEDLAQRYLLVAMISGRKAADLRSRAGAHGPRYFGLYGAEEATDSGLIQAPLADRWRSEARRLAGEAEQFIQGNELAGCAVEYKDLAVSIHYRQRPDPDPPAELLQWARDAGSGCGFRVGVGRKVLELKPQSVSKAGVFQRLVVQNGVRNALVAGDDSADVEMMHRAAQFIPGHLLRVGIASSELPEGMIEQSEIQMGSPAELIELLGRLV